MEPANSSPLPSSNSVRLNPFSIDYLLSSSTTTPIVVRQQQQHQNQIICQPNSEPMTTLNLSSEQQAAAKFSMANPAAAAVAPVGDFYPPPHPSILQILTYLQLLQQHQQAQLHQHQEQQQIQYQQQRQQRQIQQQQQQQDQKVGSTTAFPWTVAARGKPRRGMMRRAVFSDSQRVGLEKRFQLQKYISKPDRKKLAEKLGLRDPQVKIWFQNRRMKWRNSKERELLSAGGSREQTLPTRYNPNPDLSDVGETVKRLASAASNNNDTTHTSSVLTTTNK